MDRRLLLLLPLLLAVLALPVLADGPSPAEIRPSSAEIQGLIAKLGDPDFETRQKASKQLLEIGEPARKALEQTMNHSDDMEARWRAEQILRRLDRTVEKPVGPNRPAPSVPKPPRIGVGPMPPAWPGSRLEEFERQIEEMRRRMDEGFGRFHPTEKREVLEAPGLRLQIDVWGMIPNLTLTLKAKEGEPQPPRAIYRGRSLDEILRRHPELSKHAGMAALRTKYDAFRKKNRALFPFDDLFRAPRGRGVEIRQDGEKVKVKITERDATGKPLTKEYEGESLEKLKEKHPELREKLQGVDGVMSIRFGPTQLFRDRRKPRPAPVTPPSEPTVQKSFGIRARGVPEVLASQLALEKNHGMLIDAVAPESQADAIGLLRYDIVMSVNGQPITELETALGVLKMSAKDASPLTLEVIRRGQRRMLKR